MHPLVFSIQCVVVSRGNIVLARDHHEYVAFKFLGQEKRVKTHGLSVSLIDFTLSRLNTGLFSSMNCLCDESDHPIRSDQSDQSDESDHPRSRICRLFLSQCLVGPILFKQVLQLRLTCSFLS